MEHALSTLPHWLSPLAVDSLFPQETLPSSYLWDYAANGNPDALLMRMKDTGGGIDSEVLYPLLDATSTQWL